MEQLGECRLEEPRNCGLDRGTDTEAAAAAAVDMSSVHDTIRLAYCPVAQ